MTTYTLTFQTSEEIPQSGFIILTFPPEIQTSNNSFCNIMINSTLNSNVSWVISSTNFTITHNLDPSSFLFNTTIQLTMANILNPRSMAPSSYFTLVSTTFDSYNIQKSQFNVIMSNDSQIQNIFLTRNNIFLNNATLITLQFTTLADLLKTDNLEIYFSKDQIICNNSSSIIIQSLNNNSSKNLSFSIIENDQNYLAMSFNDSNCNPCPSGSTLNYSILGFSNIGTTKVPLLSDKLLVIDKNNYLIQDKSTLLSIRPNLASGNLANLTMSFSNQTTGSDTNLTISFTAQNSVSNGILLVSFPSEFLFISSLNPNNSCFVNNYNCSLSLLNGSNFGEYAFSFAIYNISCASINFFQVFIYNTIKNKPSNQPNLGSDLNIFISTLDVNNNTIDTGSLNANNYLPSTFNNFNMVNITRTNNTVSQGTDLFVFFEILNRMAQNSNFSLSLPGNQISSTNNTLCYGFYLNAYQSIFCNLTDFGGFLTINFQEFCTKNNSNLSYCPENTYISVKISNLLNSLFVPTNNSYSLQLMSFTANGLYYYEQRTSNIFFNSGLQMSVFLSFSLVLNETRITMPVSININFTLPSQISQNGSIFINFPDNLFDFSQTNCFFSFLGTINSLKSCNISTKSGDFNVLKISSINLINVCLNLDDCDAGKTLSISFQAINPSYQVANLSNLSILLQSQTNSQDNISYYLYNASNFGFIPYDMDNSFTVYRDNINLNQSTNLRWDIVLPGKFIANATIELSFPKSQILINASKIQISLVSPVVQIISSFQILTNDTNYYFLLFNQSFCSNFCLINTNVSLTIQQVSNPTVMMFSNFNDFLIQSYYLNASQFIYDSKNGVMASPELLIPTLLNVSMNRTNASLNEIISLYVNLTIPNINVTDSNLIFEFPEELIYLNLSNQNPNVMIYTFDGNSKNVTNLTSLTKTIDEYGNYYINSLQISQVCNNFCVSSQNLTMQISNIQNPLVFFQNINNSTILIQILTSNSSIISNQITYNSMNITPIIQILTISIMNCSRSLSTPNATVQIVLDFQLSNYLLAGSMIYIILPKTQISLLNTSFCTNALNNNSISCLINSNISHYQLSFPEYCSNSSVNCTSSLRRFVISVNNCVNPLKTPLKTSENTIQISVVSIFSDPYQITTDNLFLTPDIYQFYLSSIQISRTSNVAGSLSMYFFNVTLPQTILNNVIFVINFPAYLAYNSNYSNLNCTTSICISTFSENSTYISQIIISNFCISGTVCLVNMKVSLAFEVRNQGNTYDFQSNENFSIVIETSDESMDIARGEIPANTLASITPGLFLSTQLNATSYQVGAETNWTLSFQITNNLLNIDNGGRIDIILPNDVTLDSTAFLTANLINFGMISCFLQSGSQTLTITHSLSSNTSLEGSTIIVNIFNIYNPSSMKPTSSLILTSYGEINGSIVIFDQLTNGLTFQCISPGNINLITIVRDSLNLGAEVTLMMNFTTSNENDNNGMILINVLSSDEVEFSTITPLSCQNYYDNSFYNCSQYNSFLLVSNLSSYSINQTWIILVAGLKNQFYIDTFIGDANSFSIETRTSDNYSIDYQGTNLHAIPTLQPGALNVTNLIRNNDSITEEFSLRVQLIITDPVYQNNSFLKIKVPPEFILISSLFNLRCIINQITLPCYNSVYWDNYSVNELSIYNINQLQNNVNFNITISSGLRNTFFVNTQSQNIIIQSIIIVSGNNVLGLLDQASISSNNYLNQLNTKTLISCSVSCFDCSQNQTTELDIRFTIQHMFLNNIWVKIDPPSNISFNGIIYSDKRCQGLIGLNVNVDCYTDNNNSIWINDSFSGIRNPGLFSFKINSFVNPLVSGNYSGFNFSLYYNQTYPMDFSNEGMIFNCF